MAIGVSIEGAVFILSFLFKFLYNLQACACENTGVSSSCSDDLVDPLPNSKFSTSSVYTDGTHLDYHAYRAKMSSIESTTLGGGWAAMTNDGNQFIQVEFNEDKEVRKIVTAGLESSIYSFEEYVKSYTVLYSLNGHEWITVGGTYTGNSDRYNQVTNTLPTPVVARYIRINPKSWKGNVSLRFEIKGCTATEATTTPVETTTPTTQKATTTESTTQMVTTTESTTQMATTTEATTQMTTTTKATTEMTTTTTEAPTVALTTTETTVQYQSTTEQNEVTTTQKVYSTTKANCCPCYKHKSVTPEQLEQILSDLESLLLIQKSDTKAAQRKKICMDDERPSSRAIGTGGVIILVTVASIIVLCDLHTFFQKVKYCRK